MTADGRVKRSRALKPQLFTAPHPEQMSPYPYQLAGVEYRLSTPSGHGIIGDAPGVGKTAQGILTSNSMEAGRTLVTCPASLTLNWEREVWLWSTIENVDTYVVARGKDGVSPHSDYVITSFAMLRNPNIRAALLDMRFDHWIIDEAHAMKDYKGNQTTKVMCAPDMIPSVVGSITAMSGTLLPNQPIECYNAMRLLDWESIDCMSDQAFREYYYEEGGGFIMQRDPYSGEYSAQWSDKVRNQPRNLDELQFRLRSRLMVRRLKEHVLPWLPKKQWHPFPIQLTTEIRRVLRSDNWKAVEKLWQLGPDTFDKHAPIDGMVSTALRELGEAKAPAVADYIEEMLLEGTEKLVVGAWHRNVLDYLRERLDKYGLVYMDGRTTVKRKQQAVDDFQNKDEIRIILGQMGPLGEGWTLTRAQDVFFAEFFWVPGKNDQMFDRIHRPGQLTDISSVTGHLPFVPGSLDERVIGTAIEKDANIYAALDA